jgi:hypothetical protein
MGERAFHRGQGSGCYQPDPVCGHPGLLELAGQQGSPL